MVIALPLCLEETKCVILTYLSKFYAMHQLLINPIILFFEICMYFCEELLLVFGVKLKKLLFWHFPSFIIHFDF